MTCQHNGCFEAATHRFTWPGKDECYFCATHANAAQRVASAIGMHLQLIPLAPVTADKISEDATR
jgi:hypothetical protein